MKNFNKAQNYTSGVQAMKTYPEELLNWAALALVPGLDVAATLRALRDFGGPAGVLEAPLTDLSRSIGITCATAVRAVARGAEDDVLDEMRVWLDSSDDARLLPITEPAFPSRLIGTGRAPLMLYARGDVGLLKTDPVAICGASASNAEGERNAFDFGAAISAGGHAVLAVLEAGVSVAAVSGALSAVRADRKARPPVLLLATGIARAPRERAELQRTVLGAGGLLLSAEPPQAGMSAATRNRRDRLFAAIADRLLLVQAAVQDPALAVARDAAECGVSVCAVPGSIHDPLSRGGNRLIREGAALVEAYADIGF